MGVKATRRLWFLGLWLLWPWPMIVGADAFVPAIRYVLLAGVAATVAVTEGAAGPVGLIVALMLVWGLGSTLVCWLLAWLVTKLLYLAAPSAAPAVTWCAFAAGLFISIFFEPYHTAFGRALTGGLLEILS